LPFVLRTIRGELQEDFTEAQWRVNGVPCKWKRLLEKDALIRSTIRYVCSWKYTQVALALSYFTSYYIFGKIEGDLGRGGEEP